MEFYNNFGEEGVRLDTKYKACEDFNQIMKQSGFTQKALSAAAGVSLQCVRSCSDGKNVAKQTADKIAAVLDKKDIFAAVNADNQLSDNSHIHTLRHVSATMLIAGGVDIATVSKRLGHANKTTTLNVYSHAIQSADARASEKLQDMLNPSKRYSA